MIFVSQDLKHLFTTNVSSGTVSIIEKTTRTGPDFGPPPGGPPHSPGEHHGPIGPPGGDWDETVVPVGRGGEGFDVSPDGKEIWVANAQDGTVSIIDIAAKKVTQTLPPNFRGANRLKFTPDGKLVFISASGLAILDATTHKEIKHLDISRGGAGIQMQPDGSHAYAACNREGYVAAIDLKTLEVTGRIDAGQQPDGLAWAIRQ